MAERNKLHAIATGYRRARPLCGSRGPYQYQRTTRDVMRVTCITCLRLMLAKHGDMDSMRRPFTRCELCERKVARKHSTAVNSAGGGAVNRVARVSDADIAAAERGGPSL